MAKSPGGAHLTVTIQIFKIIKDGSINKLRRYGFFYRIKKSRI